MVVTPRSVPLFLCSFRYSMVRSTIPLFVPLFHGLFRYSFVRFAIPLFVRLLFHGLFRYSMFSSAVPWSVPLSMVRSTILLSVPLVLDPYSYFMIRSDFPFSVRLVYGPL